MNKKTLVLCVFATMLPLTAVADEVEVEKDFNGLDIITQVSGVSASGAGPGISGGPQVMRVSNNSTTKVKCELKAGPAEPAGEDPAPVIIEPQKSATLRLPGNYASATFKAKLTCDKA